MAAEHRPIPHTAVFGAYTDHDLYQRNRVLIQALASLSDQLTTIRPVAERVGHAFSAETGVLRRILAAVRDRWQLWRRRDELRGADLIFVPYPAYLDLLLLRWIGGLGSTPVIADAFLELHSTVVEDRGLLPSGSWRARWLRWFQRFSLARADLVLIDTPEQARRLARELAGLELGVQAVPVGIDEQLWTPLAPAAIKERIQVLFFGTFIPLHGVPTIVDAARILAQRGAAIDFVLIGDGQEADQVASGLASDPLPQLRWRRELVATDTLRDAVAEAHVVLGVFGSSVKAGEVLPYKVHQALASNRPVITREGPAVAPHADAERGLLVCHAADPLALADQIETLAQRLRGGWQPESRAIFDTHFGSAAIARCLLESCREAGVGA